MSTVLQINVSINYGAHGKIAEAIGRVAMTKGWRSVIAYGRQYNSSENELIRIGNSFSVKEHALESRLLDNHGLASRRATKHFIAAIKQLRPDVIHLHNIHGYYLNYKYLFGFLASQKIPVLWTLHDCWPFTGHCAYFDFAQCDLWRTGCHAPCPCKNNYPCSLLIDRSRKNYSIKKALFSSMNNLTLVPVSNWLGDIVKHSFLKDHPMQVIHNGIDVETFCPYSDLDELRNKYQLQGKHVCLGVANEWVVRKGLKDFLAIRRELPSDYAIVLVGVSPQQKKELPNGIVGITRTQNQKELAQIYSMADVFLNLTYEDNYPTTNLEAMACGTPVLTYNTGGSPESVGKDTGWIVEKGRIQDVVECVKVNSIKNEVMSQKCRNKAKSFFDKNFCFDKYVELYETLLHK